MSMGKRGGQARGKPSDFPNAPPCETVSACLRLNQGPLNCFAGQSPRALMKSPQCSLTFTATSPLGAMSRFIPASGRIPFALGQTVADAQRKPPAAPSGYCGHWSSAPAQSGTLTTSQLGDGSPPAPIPPRPAPPSSLTTRQPLNLLTQRIQEMTDSPVVSPFVPPPITVAVCVAQIGCGRCDGCQLRHSKKPQHVHPGTCWRVSLRPPGRGLTPAGGFWGRPVPCYGVSMPLFSLRVTSQTFSSCTVSVIGDGVSLVFDPYLE